MKAKEEKIREAYGEYWDRISNHIQYDGWINSWVWNFEIDLEMEKLIEENTPILVRPKSLQGIENNNGWLPYTGNSIGYLDIVYTDKENVFPYAVYVQYSSINEFQKITHYQQIICPPKPLY